MFVFGPPNHPKSTDLDTRSSYKNVEGETTRNFFSSVSLRNIGKIGSCVILDTLQKNKLFAGQGRYSH